MKTLLKAFGISLLLITIACQQEKKSGETEEPIEDGFTEDQFKDMAHMQQVANSRDAARMDSLISTNQFIQTLKVFPFNSLSAPEELSFNTLTDAIKEQGTTWTKAAFDTENNVLEIAWDNYLIKFKGYNNSGGEIATIVVSEWYHATNKVLSFYYHSPHAKRLVKNNEDIHQLNTAAFLDAGYVSNSKAYHPDENYDTALDYQLTDDGIVVVFNAFTAANYLQLEDITDRDVVASYMIKWDDERAEFLEPTKLEDENIGPAVFSLIKQKGLEWIPLTKQGSEWIIYEECMYGSGGLTFDENGKWLELSGGGDANSHDIKRIEKTNDGIEMTYLHALTGNTIVNSIGFLNGDIMVMESDNGEARYVLKSSASKVKTVTQECDEEQ
ncbi:MAG TPA: hypothetical protein VD927_10990 [Chryseosolibacter sp.]|nr:hypothetical protein [Chryseosolibacter sp.]